MTKSKRVRVQLGSVSSGTHRHEDLIPAFLDVLRDATGGCPLVSEIEERIEVEGDEYWGSLSSDDDLDALLNALNEYAPPYVSFGAHPGDGADFGFWPDWDAIESARRDGELPAGDAVPDRGTDGDLFLHVSDHGNAEMFRHEDGEWKSVWSAV